MAKILHTADLHLGTTFYSLNSEKAQLRIGELVKVFDDMIELLKRENVDYFLIAGDLFDNTECIKTAEYVSLKFAEIPNVNVLIAAGNHDPKMLIYDKISWSDNVHIFHDTMDYVEFDDCIIYGASFLKKYQRTPLLSNAGADSDDKAKILLMHGDFADEAYNLIDKNILSEFDYSALGHIHKYSGIQKVGKGRYAYSGTPAGRGFDEDDECGFLLGSVDKNAVNLDFVKTDVRKYHTVNFNTGKCETNADIVEGVKAITDKNDLYSINLIGECDFAISTEYIQSALENECFYIKVTDCTNDVVDYNELVNDYSIKGIFVGKMLEKIENEYNSKVKEEYRRALKCGLAVLDGRGDLFD